MNNQSEQDLHALKKIEKAGVEIKRLWAEHAPPEIMAEAYEEMRKHLAPNLMDRMIASHRKHLSGDFDCPRCKKQAETRGKIREVRDAKRATG